MHRLAVACALLAVTIFARAQDCPKDDVSPACTDMRANASFERADQELNIVYQQLLLRMSKPAEQYLDYPTLRSKFVDAQRKWIDFRDAECDAWYVVNEAGTGRNDDLMECLVDRTKNRTQQLKAWQANLP
jgi:uncharacterized protein YecT (DUF1311 family)